MVKKLQKISRYRPSIFQGKLGLSDPPRAGMSLAMEHPVEAIVFRILCVALVCMLLGYLYFVSATVLNIIARKEANIEVAKIQGSLAGFEQQYFALSQGVDRTVAASLGLSSLESAQYVYVPGSTASAGALVGNEL